MNKLLATVIAGVFTAVTFSAFAADTTAPADRPAVHKKHHAKKHHKAMAPKADVTNKK